MNTINHTENQEIVNQESAKIKAFMESIAISQKAILEAQNKISKHLEETYPLSHFIDKSFIRFREKWGYFNEDHKNGKLTSENFEYYNYFRLHYVYSGEQMNTKMYTEIFDINKQYILFVEYDCESQEIDEINRMLFENRLIYDYLIFEVIP